MEVRAGRARRGILGTASAKRPVGDRNVTILGTASVGNVRWTRVTIVGTLSKFTSAANDVVGVLGSYGHGCV